MPRILFPSHNTSAEIAPGETLLDAARRADVGLESPCDGAGTCGKCAVRMGAACRPKVTEHAHDLLSAAEQADGWVLACQTTVNAAVESLEVELKAASEHSEGLRILSEGRALEVALEPWISKRFDAAMGTTQVVAGAADADEISLGSEPGDTTGRLYGLAVDIGTTTIVSTLVDLRTGAGLASASSLNPQVRHGQDVLSRIKMGSQPEGLAQLQGDVIAELSRHAADVAAQAGIGVREIYEAVFSGNTTMLYLAVGENLASLGKSPYTLTWRGAEHVGAAEIGYRISPHGLVYLPPVMSAYVGADIAAGLLAARLPEARGVTLFVDIGTNGEMALARDGRLAATSTAAGPAFEGMNIACGMRAGRGAVERVSLSDNGANDGLELSTIGDAEPVGLCGSGLLDAVAELARHGGVDKNGRFQNKPADTSTAGKPWRVRWETVDGKPVFRIAGPVYLSEKDVRQVQFAKGAIRAGIELMLRAEGLEPAQVDRVLIAGSFGFHLRVESLLHLGLLPGEFAGRVEFVGNTSRTGALALLLNHPARERLARIAENVRVLELANDPAFEKTFLQSLPFQPFNITNP